MKNNRFKLLLGAILATMLGFCSLEMASASLGDIWALPGNVWRVNSSGHLVPGTTAVKDIGSSSLVVRSVYGSDVNLSYLTSAPITGTNATYTIPSRSFHVLVPSINTDRTWTLPAPYVGADMLITDSAGNVNVNGNITLNASSGTTVNGGSNIKLKATYGTIRLTGVSSTKWVGSSLGTP